jgi:hypothetical protein
MISSDAYLTTVRDRLIQDGCTVTNEPIGSVQAMVGYRSNIKALSKVHLGEAGPVRRTHLGVLDGRHPSG